MKNLLIVGTGGFAIEVFEHAQNSIGYGTEYLIKGFIEGNIPCDYEKYKSLPANVFGNCIEYQICENDIFFLAIADPIIKEKVANIILNKGGEFINLIHNTSVVSKHAKLGSGIFLGAFSIVTGDAIIDDFVMINTYSGISHGCKIGAYSSVMGHVGINGNTIIGHHSYWGSGSRCLPGSRIGNNTKIGAASLVLKKVKDNSTVFGVPAKYI